MRFYVLLTRPYLYLIGAWNGWFGRGGGHTSKHPIWIEREQAACSETGLDILWRERYFPFGAVQSSEMLLADCIYTSLLKSIHLVTIRGLEGCERCYITRLELVGGMRRETTKENIVLETELEDFEGFVRSKAVADQDAWSAVSSFFGFGIKYTLKPL